ncbi:alanine racemase [Bulleidia sp. zg-1006]|uniref:alanine racemase n=1 Tax=Bulleidia sp. zg-1006 TaxID=2806552 RepID=UPI00193AD8FD|nr:alanine racemase [Bulleidia sp. zg-1006]QRG86474.1 alanine racemase [Bulleidia sp. zg-1006]
MHRQTWFEIDLGKIKHNIQQVQSFQQKEVMAILKANAYGCGDVQLAETLADIGIRFIGVSSVDEALVLRKHGFQGKILVLGGSNVEDLEVLIQNHITVTAYSNEWVKEFSQHDLTGLRIHLKLNTGMNRIGFSSFFETKAALLSLQNKKAQIDGIFTHYYLSDSDKENTARQFHDFKEIVTKLEHPFSYIHADNSDASLYFKDDLTNMVRVGIGLYGYSAYHNGLQEALSLYTKPIMVKIVRAGETIGYGATYTTEKDEVIATLPIGYADGLLRINQGRKVYVDGQYGTLVGRICMDQCMVKLEKKISLEDTVEIFGPHISLNQMALETHTISYEIISLITPRVTRVYKDGDMSWEINWRHH